MHIHHQWCSVAHAQRLTLVPMVVVFLLKGTWPSVISGRTRGMFHGLRALCPLSGSHWQPSPQIGEEIPTNQRTNQWTDNYLRNPKFCVGCFEFYLSKILRQHLKQGIKKKFCDFFHRKADYRIAILLELNVVFPIAMIFHHLGLNCTPCATSVQNSPPHKKTCSLGGRLWGRGTSGQGQKIFLFLRFFLRNPFLRRAQSQKLIFFCVFFSATKQHVGPGINYFRKLLGFARYTENEGLIESDEYIVVFFGIKKLSTIHSLADCRVPPPLCRSFSFAAGG